jgi:ABC-2 type transport system permease protein
MSRDRTVWLVARRELSTKLHTRSFVVSTVAALLVLAAFVLAQSTLFDGNHRSTIGLNGQAISVAGQLADEARQVSRDVRTVEVTNLADGQAQVADGRLDVLVSGAPAALTVLVDQELDDELRGVLNGLTRQQVLRGQLAAIEDLAPEGIDVEAVLRNVAEAHVEVRSLTAVDPRADERLAIALIVVALLYLSLLLYGSMVAHGVVEEKSGRIVEYLLSAVRPAQLLGGKVAGLGLVGLIQLAIVGFGGLILGLALKVVTAAGPALIALAWGLVWYVLGFLLYAMVFATLAALVSRQDDMQSVLMPVTAVLVVAFVLGCAVLSRNPAGTTSTVLSLLPPLSPILMPGRITLAAAPFWQVALALALTVATIVALARIGGVAYQNSLLRKDSRSTLRDALRKR